MINIHKHQSEVGKAKEQFQSLICNISQSKPWNKWISLTMKPDVCTKQSSPSFFSETNFHCLTMHMVKHDHDGDHKLAFPTFKWITQTGTGFEFNVYVS